MDVKDLVFVQITFEKYTLHFYYKNDKVGIKMEIVNLQPLLVLNVSIFTYFYAASLLIKTCFIKPVTLFISRTRRIFTKLFTVFESSIKREQDNSPPDNCPRAIAPWIIVPQVNCPPDTCSPKIAIPEIVPQIISSWTIGAQNIAKQNNWQLICTPK